MSCGFETSSRESNRIVLPAATSFFLWFEACYVIFSPRLATSQTPGTQMVPWVIAGGLRYSWLLISL